MVKSRKYISLLLLAVYAFFFASTNFFYHTHRLANGIIVHSHPFSNPEHSHTASQILLIDAIHTAVYLESAEQSVPERAVAFIHQEVIGERTKHVLHGLHITCSLRAPPASC